MSNYPHRTRMIRRECIGNEISYDCASGTVSQALTLPASAFAIGLAVHNVANAGTVTITAAPYADHDQTVTDGSYKFLKTGAATATTNISIAATSTEAGWTGMVVPAGDQYGAAAPIITVHGSQLSITTASVTGALTIAYSAVEL